MNRLIQATGDDIRGALKAWIDEADSDTIERVWNENFDSPVIYLVDQGVFELDQDEAERNGIDTL